MKADKFIFPNGAVATKKQESTKTFLKRTARELAKQMPGLKTKAGFGQTKPVDHYPRLVQAYSAGGIAAVQAYCDERIAFYNAQIKARRESKLTVAHKK